MEVLLFSKRQKDLFALSLSVRAFLAPGQPRQPTSSACHADRMQGRSRLKQHKRKHLCIHQMRSMCAAAGGLAWAYAKGREPFQGLCNCSMGQDNARDY